MLQMRALSALEVLSSQLFIMCKKQKMMSCYGRDRVQAGVGPINSFSTRRIEVLGCVA